MSFRHDWDDGKMVNGEDEGEVCIKVRGGMYDTSRA